ncbi:hypothetical protein quinque_002614 [Culex quinquefasciatus]
MVNKCYVTGCTNNRDKYCPEDVGIFKFPKDGLLLSQRIDFCGFEDPDKKLPQSAGICTEHFEPEMLIPPIKHWANRKTSVSASPPLPDQLCQSSRCQSSRCQSSRCLSVSTAVASPAVANPAVASPAVACSVVASSAVASPAVASPAVASPAVACSVVALN